MKRPGFYEGAAILVGGVLNCIALLAVLALEPDLLNAVPNYPLNALSLLVLSSILSSLCIATKFRKVIVLGIETGFNLIATVLIGYAHVFIFCTLATQTPTGGIYGIAYGTFLAPLLTPLWLTGAHALRIADRLDYRSLQRQARGVANA